MERSPIILTSIIRDPPPHICIALPPVLIFPILEILQTALPILAITPKSLFGGLQGFATDLGVNYQWKDEDKKYKINAGMSIRNIGSMTFSDNNNTSNSYTLVIPAPTFTNPGLEFNSI